MKKLLQLAGLSLAVLIAGPVSADELTPIPEIPGTIYGAPVAEQIVEGPVYVDSAPIPLFTSVKYVDRKKMHPCAVPKIIRVNDPCPSHGCCGPQCVYIEICVPPCGCEHVKCRKHGDRMRYDYGKYAVDVRVKKGYIVVDYKN